MTAPMVDYKIHWLKMMSVPESRAVVGRHDGINGRDRQYVLYTKVEALKRATTVAQPVINDLALFYNDIAKAESTVTLGEAVAEFVVAQEDYDKLAEPNLQQIDEYVAAASRFDAILSAMNAHPLQAFADAHERLYSELNGKITLPEALSAIEIFVARAQEFRQIVDDFELAPKGE